MRETMREGESETLCGLEEECRFRRLVLRRLSVGDSGHASGTLDALRGASLGWSLYTKRFAWAGPLFKR